LYIAKGQGPEGRAISIAFTGWRKVVFMGTTGFSEDSLNGNRNDFPNIAIESMLIVLHPFPQRNYSLEEKVMEAKGQRRVGRVNTMCCGTERRISEIHTHT
jgi:hypothetical protein